MRPSSMRLSVATVLLMLLQLAPLATAYQPNSPYYGAGRRIPLTSIKTLTFYSGRKTAYRRTSPLPQLTCVGSPCSRYQPDVVQCTAMGDGQWKCSADLPATMRMGRVEVSCEGYDYADDPFVLKDSCALEYTLLPSGIGRDDAWSGAEYRSGASGRGERMVEMLFQMVFWAVLATIVVSFVRAVRSGNAGNRNTAGGNGGGGGGGGGGGYGGGGWWPGGSHPPPPPYTPKPEPDASPSSSWRPGFWTGLGLGGLAASAAASSSRRRQQPSFFQPDPYGYDSFGAGPSAFGGRRRAWDDNNDRGSSSGSAWRESTGFGGTRNR